MAENLTDLLPPPPPPASSDVSSTLAAAVSLHNSLFSRKIEFHLERKPYSPISNSSDSRNFHLETLNPSNSQPQKSMAAAPVPSQSAKRSDGGFDPELSFRITFRRIGAGLANLGNTCFLNSVLQCLTYTEPFAAYLQSGKHKSSCRTAGFCALCALQNHVMNALQSSGKILSPFHLVKNLRCISRNFRNSRQEDAHEYMVNLLESMHKCCLPSGVPTESPSAYEKSLVHKIFGGCLRSQVKCTQCQYCSNKIEPFLDLSLEIVNADTLRKALAHFTAAEQLDGGERQYQCQRCKEKVRASKQLTVHKAPHVLTIHLKRFGPHIPGQKIDKKVYFEPTLDLKPFVSDPHESDLKYTLYGVLVHAGWSTHSGHYYCFVRTSTGIWHSLDDNRVVQVSEKTVLSQKAYMLFYVRDRSSMIKRSAEVAHKDNILSNAPGNKVTPKSALVSEGGIQTNGRKLSISECSLTKSSIDNASHYHPTSVAESSSSGQPLSNKAESLQKNGNNLQETQLLQLGKVSSNKLQQTALAENSEKVEISPTNMPFNTTSNHNQKAMEESSQPSFLKESGIHNQSMTESGQDYQEMPKPSVLAAQPVNFGFLNPGVLVRESECGDRVCMMNGVSPSVSKELRTVSSQLNKNNGPIGNKYFSKTHTEIQNTDPESDKSTSGMHYENNGEGLDSSIMMSSGETEAVAVTERESVSKCSQAELKRKKPSKSLSKGQYFGRKQLFLTSLQLHKKKKHKSKKRLSNCKKVKNDKVEEGIITNDQVPSTSEAVLPNLALTNSSKKRSHSRSHKQSVIKGMDDVKYDIGNFVHNRNIDQNNMNDAVPATLEQQKSPLNSAGNLCDEREPDAFRKGPAGNGVVTLLMGLKGTAVPRWDDTDMAASQLLSGNAQTSNIGYVLDEWDEEYDQGRRKKLKKSKQRPFGGPNPFQEIDNMKLKEKMKINHIASGIQPLMI